MSVSFAHQNVAVRLEIHVKPGASRTEVGGEYDGALVVRVAEPAEGGRATKAALRAVADALTLPRRSVTLVRGSTSRHKVIDVDTENREEESVARATTQLRRGTRA
jgi:uncharacterized protein YggU (UPF0235/DUF167 family)